ncbi:FMNH2-dependent monooxygenase [Streptomyces anandii]|uniref:FMNH2-dependent monooxygenase n=1 Tax=Streptomyces anandii TaxID=285454 RepID=UPI0036B8B95C
MAPATHRVGPVPTATATAHIDAPRVGAAVAALDRAGRGRAGRRVDVPAAAAGEAAEQAAPGRESAQEHRSEQGRPVCVVDATEAPARRAAARYADVALMRAASSAQAGAVRGQLRADAAESGRAGRRPAGAGQPACGPGRRRAGGQRGHGGGGPRPTARGPLYRGGPADPAELIAAWHQDGAADGFRLVPTEPRRDLERLVNATVALLQHRGLFRTFCAGSTLREHLGLARPAGRCAVTGGAAS